MTKAKNSLYFSVVIPIHNKEPHIKRCLDSVLNQTYKHFEVIIIDDASIDNSMKIVSKYSDDRLKILTRNKPGPGGYAARNKGVSESKANWVAFLDADDEWYPDYLQNMKRLSLQYNHAGILGCGYIVRKKLFGEEINSYNSFYKENQYKGNQLISFKQYLKLDIDGKRPNWTSATCIKKEIILKAGGFPDKITRRGGDVDTWLRCVELANGLAYGDFIGALYYRESVNMVTKNEIYLANAERETIKRFLNKYKNKDILKLLKRYSNKRTIRAWYDNVVNNKKNIILVNKLYYSVNTYKNIIYAIISIIPNKLIRYMYFKIK